MHWLKWVVLVGLHSLLASELRAAEPVPRVALLFDRTTVAPQYIQRGFREYTQQVLKRDIYLQAVNLQNMSAAGRKAAIGNQYDLLITVGYSATLSAIDQTPNAPIIALLVSRPQLDALNKDSLKAAFPVTGIYDEQPYYRFARLAKQLLPETRSMGMLFSQASKTELPRFKRIMDINQFQPVALITLPSDSPQRLMQQLVMRSDVLLTSSDSNIYSETNVKSHFLTAFRNQVPVLGSSENYIELGALAALWTDPQELGKQAAQLSFEQLTHPKTVLSPRYPEAFEIAINQFVARSRGVEQITIEQLRTILEKKPFTEKESD